MARQFKIGTRGSRLARAQTDLVIAALRRAQPDLTLQVVEVRTEGDRQQATPLMSMAGRGVFVKELEAALLERRIDVAVHSLKDMPTEVPPDLVIAAVAERADPRDALVSRYGLALAALPAGARVGTSSPRRIAQLRARRPDLEFLPLRGNVDTRLRKVAEGALDGLVLALAGLARLGLAGRAAEVISTDICLPAVGQGALALETRVADYECIALARLCDHAPTRLATAAERAFLHGLGGGCQTPIAAYAQIAGPDLVLDGLVAAPDGSRLVRDRIAGASDDADALGQDLARRLLARGARELLATYG